MDGDALDSIDSKKEWLLDIKNIVTKELEVLVLFSGNLTKLLV